MGAPQELMLAATLLLTACAAQDGPALTRMEFFGDSKTCTGTTPIVTLEQPEGTCSAPTDAQLAAMGITGSWIGGWSRERHCLCVCRRVSN